MPASEELSCRAREMMGAMRPPLPCLLPGQIIWLMVMEGQGGRSAGVPDSVTPGTVRIVPAEDHRVLSG